MPVSPGSDLATLTTSTFCCSATAEQLSRVHAFVAPDVPCRELLPGSARNYLLKQKTYQRSRQGQTGPIVSRRYGQACCGRKDQVTSCHMCSSSNNQFG